MVEEKQLSSDVPAELHYLIHNDVLMDWPVSNLTFSFPLDAEGFMTKLWNYKKNADYSRFKRCCFFKPGYMEIVYNVEDLIK